MKKLFVAACCLLLTGCGGFVFPGPADAPLMESGAQAYPSGAEGGFEPAPTAHQMTSTCTMKGKGVVCR